MFEQISENIKNHLYHQFPVRVKLVLIKPQRSMFVVTNWTHHCPLVDVLSTSMHAHLNIRLLVCSLCLTKRMKRGAKTRSREGGVWKGLGKMC